MYIEELHLQNFRGFKELKLQFPRNLAVIIGVNGSGKSSILDAIAIFLEFYVSKIMFKTRRNKSTSSDKTALTKDDIYIKSHESYNLIQVVIEPYKKISWSIRKSKDNSKNQKVEKQELLNHIKNTLEDLGNDPSLSLPVLVYYQTHRMVLTFPSQLRLYSLTTAIRPGNQLKAYEGAFSNEVNNFQDFFQWFKEEEDYENEIRLRENTNYRNKNLEVVRTAITKFLNHFPQTYFSNLHVVRLRTDQELETRRFTPTLTIEKNGQNFKLEKLSDGEKMLLMVVTDLAKRLAILNPSVEEPEKVLEGKGIVLIDEVDLHLHPQWQRIVVPALTNTFPNCQFIVTTHSPQVLSRVHKENVFILENYQVIEETPYTFGKDSNSILYELMGVTERPLEVQQQLDECFQLIDDNKIEDAKIKLKKLTNLLGEDDPELVRAYTLINFFNRKE
ncbi:AAA family ATPase [Planktothrix mougeotii]|uniref:AAA family ATPase n=1 Tax=Planktothrix mougeotii LEGE 06226 TaxID=1828728 RepID=A0ABR9U8G5_9CYAN|nr:AAA family ATPase [Planktothrix mougeotii]MBE9142749.1 AAA family ATPase [Planktothrix mougeotii LEGE 06226]